MSEWTKIDPDDASTYPPQINDYQILLWRKDYGFHVVEIARSGYDARSWELFWVEDNDGVWYRMEPNGLKQMIKKGYTHWHPLPPPPEAK